VREKHCSSLKNTAKVVLENRVIKLQVYGICIHFQLFGHAVHSANLVPIFFVFSGLEETLYFSST